MSTAGLALLIVALAGAADEGASDTCTVMMVAVQATNEGRATKFFGPGLDKVRSALASFDYDTYTRITSTTKSIPIGKETRLIIDEHYTLIMDPISSVQDGRIRVKARILMKGKGGKIVNALDTTLTMVLGKHLNLGGLRLPKGELILVLTVQAG